MSIDSNLKINTEVVKLEPSQLLNLFELDTSSCIKDPYDSLITLKYYFHGYNIRPTDSNAATDEEKLSGIIEWQSNKYFYYPIEAEGFELLGDGTLPRPILRVANITPIIRDLTLNLGDMVGATITLRRVFRKLLIYPDGSNPEADENAEIPSDVYVVSRKKTENRLYIEFELVSTIEANNVQLPRRQILKRYCSWKYRGEGCEFNKAVIIDKNDIYYGNADPTWSVASQNLSTPTAWVNNSEYNVNDVIYHTVQGRQHYFLCKLAHTSSPINRFSSQYWIPDVCSKCLAACQARFGVGAILPFGGFPSVGNHT